MHQAEWLEDRTLLTPGVRMVYLIPADHAEQPQYREEIGSAIQDLQSWYSSQMEDERTFQLHDPIVETYQTSHVASWYATNNANENPSLTFWNNVLADGFALTGGMFNDPENRWIFYIDADPGRDQLGGAGTSGVAVLPANDLRGLSGEPIVQINGDEPTWFGRDRWVGGLGHELGHAFNLPHPPECTDDDPNTVCINNALMWTGFYTYPDSALTESDRATLADSQFFVTPDNLLPIVRLSISPASVGESFETSIVTATLSTVSDVDVTVSLAFSGTATQSIDYMPSAAQIVIHAGSLTGTLELHSLPDELVEPDETVVVEIVSVTNGIEAGIQQVSATILNSSQSIWLELAGNGVTATGKQKILALLQITVNGQTVPVGSTLNLNFEFAGTEAKVLDRLFIPSAKKLGIRSRAVIANGHLNLQIDLKSDLRPAELESFLRNIRFRTRKAGLNAAPRILTLALTPGNGEPSVVSQTIFVQFPD